MNWGFTLRTKLTPIGLLIVGGLMLASCAGGGPTAGAADEAGASTDTPAEFIIGTWDCSGYVDGVKRPEKLTYTVSKDTIELQLDDFLLVADYNVVGDSLISTITELSEGGGEPGAVVTVDNFPLVMPEVGEKITLVGSTDDDPGQSFVAYMDGDGAVFWEEPSGATTIECARQ